MQMAFVAKKDVWHRWFVPLGAVFLFLNLFDLAITFWGVQTRVAYEANRLMAPIIHDPFVTTLVKLGLNFLALKIAQRIEQRTRFSSVPILIVMDLYMLMVCVSNVLTCFGSNPPTWFHRMFPLA
jgi:hypothetical protein